MSPPAPARPRGPGPELVPGLQRPRCRAALAYVPACTEDHRREPGAHRHWLVPGRAGRAGRLRRAGRRCRAPPGGGPRAGRTRAAAASGLRLISRATSAGNFENFCPRWLPAGRRLDCWQDAQRLPCQDRGRERSRPDRPALPKPRQRPSQGPGSVLSGLRQRARSETWLRFGSGSFRRASQAGIAGGAERAGRAATPRACSRHGGSPRLDASDMPARSPARTRTCPAWLASVRLPPGWPPRLRPEITAVADVLQASMRAAPCRKITAVCDATRDKIVSASWPPAP